VKIHDSELLFMDEQFKLLEVGVGAAFCLFLVSGGETLASGWKIYLYSGPQRRVFIIP
jgi:hypothetical protein